MKKNIFMYSILLFVVLISVFPILWIVLSSFKSNGEILSTPLSIPMSFNFTVYFDLLTEYNFFQFF